MGDYIIKYNNVEIPVNPDIFSEKSETFRQYFDPNQKMTITGERSVDQFKQLLPYVQGEEPTITADNVSEIESFADEWEIQSLRDIIENWKKTHEIDLKLEQFLENSRERISVSPLIPGMVEDINDLFNKPKFLEVPPKLLSQILSSAIKQEKIKDHHNFNSFVLKYYKQDQVNRFNILNFVNPYYLGEDEVENFFTSQLIPDDPYLLSQIPNFLTRLALLFKDKYNTEQTKISSINSDIQKQDSIYERENKKYQSLQSQLTSLQRQQQQQQQQQSQQYKKTKPKSNPLVYTPGNQQQEKPVTYKKQDTTFHYSPSDDSTPSTTTKTTTSTTSTSTSPRESYNSRQERGGRGRGRGGYRSSSRQSTEQSNPNVGVVVMQNEVPAGMQSPFQQMPMQMPMNQQMPMQIPINQQMPMQIPMNQQMPMQMPINQQMPMQMPMNQQMQMNPNMNVSLMSDAQINELKKLQNQIHQQMAQIINQNSNLQADKLNELSYRYKVIQDQLEQQLRLKTIQKNQMNPQISVKTSPLGSPMNPINHQPPPQNNNKIQFDKLVPNISVEKPKTKGTAMLGAEQKAQIAAKKVSVKIEKPSKGVSIEFGNKNSDQT